MNQQSVRRRIGKRGSALIAATLFAAVFGLVAAWITLATQRQMRATFQTRVFENTLNASASQVRAMFNQARYIIETRPPQFAGNLLQINPSVNGISPPALTGFAVVNDAQNRPLSFVENVGPNDFAFREVTTVGDQWRGYSTARLQYDIYSFMRENSPTADRLGFTGAGYRQRITFDYVPLYQYAIFYNSDMELHNGPNMDVRGPVHSNKNLFYATGARLSFWDRVSCVGSLNCYNDFTTKLNGNAGNINNATAGNAVTAPFIYAPESFNNYGTVEFPAATGTSRINMVVPSNDGRDTNGNRYLDSGDNNFAATAQTLWGESMKDGSRGTFPIKLPLPDTAQPEGNNKDKARVIIERVQPTDDDATKATKFEGIADVKITGDPGTPSTITVKAGNTVIPNVYTRSNGTTASIWKVGEFFDGQQMTVVKTIDVDMGNLKERLGSTLQSGNGVVYVSTTPVAGDTWTNKAGWNDWKNTGQSDYMPAVRVNNATDVPKNSDNGFTVATDRPIYVTGNFNTTNKGTAVIAADSVTLTTQELTLEILNPATGAVVQAGNTREGNASAANATAKTNKVNPSPVGSSLTTNAIMVMGDTPSRYKDPNVAFNASDPNTYPISERKPGYVRAAQSGGAHNVMRYLEGLGSVTHNFTGSMIVLFESKYARNNWFNQNFTYNGVNFGGYYGPPTRNYVWDSSLRTTEPPKGMLFFINIAPGTLERIAKSTAETARP